MSRIFASPGRYVQGKGVVNELGSLAMKHGTSAFFVSDDNVWNIIGDPVTASFDGVDGKFTRGNFAGECTISEISRLTEVAVDFEVDVVLGVGGGKAIDTAKAVSERIDTPLGTVPTIASNDSPTSSISVLYDDDGVLQGGEQHDFHPEFVLVDTEVIAQAPKRWFVSGIGDALATWYEARATWKSGGTTVFGGRPTYTGQALAKTCHRLLRDHAERAVRAVEANVVTESVEATTEAVVLLSGLGFENGGLAAAHAIHDGLTTLPQTKEATHGEKVLIGLLTQLILERASDETISDLVSFAESVGLPVSLAEIGITSPTQTDLRQVGRVACEAEQTMQNEPTETSPEEIADALLAVDSLER